MPHSYEVCSPRYLGIAALKPEFVSQTSRELVNPDKNISGRKIKGPTVGSYGHAAPILIQTIDACGNPIWENRTSNNTFKSYDVPINGYFSPQIDDGVIRGNYQFPPIANWKAAGEESQAREYVVYPKKSINYGLIESFGERQLKLDEGSTPVNLFVHDFSYNGPINDFGKYSHLVRNLKQTLMNHYGTKDLQRLAAALQSKGMPLEDIGWLASGFVPKDVIYGVARLPDGKIIFVGAEDSFDKMVQEARYHGLKREDIEFLRIGEEITHIGRKSYDRAVGRIREEKSTKRTLTDIILEMAEDSEGNPELVRHYLKLAEFMEGDIKTTRKRYRKSSFSPEENLDTRVEEIVGDDVTASDREYSTADGLMSNPNSKVISMPKYRSKGKETEEKGKVIYAKDSFSKYEGRNAESEGKPAKSDAISDADTDASSKGAGAKSESAESGGEAEGTGEGAKAA